MSTETPMPLSRRLRGGAVATHAWLLGATRALLEEELAAVEVVGPAYEEATAAGRLEDEAVRRHIEAWARSSRDLGDALDVETRQWCRNYDARVAVSREVSSS